MESLALFWHTTGVANLTWETVVMMVFGGVLMYWAIAKEFESVFLVSFGFAVILANVPSAGMAEPGGFLHDLYEIGVRSGAFPALVFFGLGTLADFGPLIAMPSLLFVGAAAQVGIFITLFAALGFNGLLGWGFGLEDVAGIALIGGAYAPVVLFFGSRLAPDLLGVIAVAIYVAMALVPMLQPPIMRALTTEPERQVNMAQPRLVSKGEKLFFPLVVLLLCILFLPDAALLLGMFVFGNFLKESEITERIARLSHVKTVQADLIHIVTLFFGLAVGGQLSAEKFLSVGTLAIVVLGIIALSVGTASGVLIGKLLCQRSHGKINPLIGASGIAVVPLSARVASKLGLEANPHNFLLIHAIGANLAGVIGSAVAAGTLLAMLSGK